MKLYVGNLPYSATEDEIRTLFENYGSITDLHIPTDRETGRPRGFAFVTFSNREGGEAAIEGLDGSDMGGRSLRISEAQERQPRQGGGGFDRGHRGGGGGGGGRDSRGRDRDRDRNRNRDRW